jgi:hypothetical protein
MALHGKEKLWFLFDLIRDEAEVTDKNEDIGIAANDLDFHFDKRDLQIMFKKLETENAVKFIHNATDQTWGRYLVRLLPDFDKFQAKLDKDDEYLEFSGRKPNTNDVLSISKDLPSDTMLQITYTKSRQVLLNNMFQLAQPTFNGENDQVFSFLIQNPNKSFTKKQLEETLNIKITKPFHKIVENLGFKGDLVRIFFSISKNNISFNNPVSQEHLEQMGIGKIRLNKTNST